MLLDAIQNPVLKVSISSNPGKVAGAIAAMIREGKEVKLRAVGALANYRAASAIAFAQVYLMQDGLPVSFTSTSILVTVDDHRQLQGYEYTVVRLP